MQYYFTINRLNDLKEHFSFNYLPYTTDDNTPILNIEINKMNPKVIKEKLSRGTTMDGGKRLEEYLLLDSEKQLKKRAKKAIIIIDCTGVGIKKLLSNSIWIKHITNIMSGRYPEMVYKKQIFIDFVFLEEFFFIVFDVCYSNFFYILLKHSLLYIKEECRKN